MSHNRHRLTIELSHKTKSALSDVDNFLIGALCILRAEDVCGDPGNPERMDALVTLLEYGRGTVSDAKESLEDMLICCCGEHSKAPDPMSYTELLEAEVPPLRMSREIARHPMSYTELLEAEA